VNARLLDEAESIKEWVDRVLPRHIRDRMSVAGIHISVSAATTIPSAVAGVSVVVDEEGLAEQELVGDMVSLGKDITGVDNTIFVSTKGYGRHAARIKIAIDPPHSFNAACESASMTIHDFGIRGAYMPPHLARQAEQFIQWARDILLGYWDGEFDTIELVRRLQQRGPPRPD
jgi:hypothetical protein